MYDSPTVDYSTLSNDEYAEQLAKDFSTPAVTLKSEKYDDDMYFLRSDDTDKVSANISFSEYGNNITLSLNTDGSEDECYYVLLQALKSDLFGIDFDDQIDILAHYKVDEIDYKKGTLRIVYKNMHAK